MNLEQFLCKRHDKCLEKQATSPTPKGREKLIEANNLLKEFYALKDNSIRLTPNDIEGVLWKTY